MTLPIKRDLEVPPAYASPKQFHITPVSEFRWLATIDGVWCPWIEEADIDLAVEGHRATIKLPPEARYTLRYRSRLRIYAGYVVGMTHVATLYFDRMSSDDEAVFVDGTYIFDASKMSRSWTRADPLTVIYDACQVALGQETRSVQGITPDAEQLAPLSYDEALRLQQQNARLAQVEAIAANNPLFAFDPYDLDTLVVKGKRPKKEAPADAPSLPSADLPPNDTPTAIYFLQYGHIKYQLGNQFLAAHLLLAKSRPPATDAEMLALGHPSQFARPPPGATWEQQISWQTLSQNYADKITEMERVKFEHVTQDLSLRPKVPTDPTKMATFLAEATKGFGSPITQAPIELGSGTKSPVALILAGKGLHNAATTGLSNVANNPASLKSWDPDFTAITLSYNYILSHLTEQGQKKAIFVHAPDGTEVRLKEDHYIHPRRTPREVISDVCRRWKLPWTMGVDAYGNVWIGDRRLLHPGRLMASLDHNHIIGKIRCHVAWETNEYKKSRAGLRAGACAVPRFGQSAMVWSDPEIGPFPHRKSKAKEKRAVTRVIRRYQAKVSAAAAKLLGQLDVPLIYARTQTFSMECLPLPGVHPMDLLEIVHPGYIGLGRVISHRICLGYRRRPYSRITFKPFRNGDADFPYEEGP